VWCDGELPWTEEAKDPFTVCIARQRSAASSKGEGEYKHVDDSKKAGEGSGCASKKDAGSSEKSDRS
jgi:hypothetical protein